MSAFSCLISYLLAAKARSVVVAKATSIPIAMVDITSWDFFISFFPFTLIMVIFSQNRNRKRPNRDKEAAFWFGIASILNVLAIQ
jgi:hypothetical protein